MRPRTLFGLPLRNFSCLLFSFLVVLWCHPASALDNIHDSLWYVGSGHIPANGQLLNVTFDGNITSADASALTFYILENASQDTLVGFSTNINPLPPVGTPVVISFGFKVRCTVSGELEAQISSIYVTYCDPINGANNYYDPDLTGPWWKPSGSGGAFSLAVAGENGNADQSAVGTVQCGAVAESPGSLLSQIKLQRQERLDRLAADGDSGTIGIYFDEAGTICSGSILPGSPTAVYVIAKLNGITECGIHGGEFRFAGIPESWQVYPVARGDMLAIGNPFVEGVTFGITQCEQPTNGAVLLYTVLVVATGVESDVKFEILPRNPPSNPKSKCALLSVCDSPFFGTVCEDGIACYVNPTVPKACEVAVAIEDATWGSIKTLFR